LKGIVIKNESYVDLQIPDGSVVYCDPPYANTTKYKDGFNHELFWAWVRGLVSQGHDVFVSEYVAPEDFVSVWSKTVNNTLVKDTGSKTGVERLFRYYEDLK